MKKFNDGTYTCGFVSNLPDMIQNIFKRHNMNKKLKIHAKRKFLALLSSLKKVN